MNLSGYQLFRQYIDNTRVPEGHNTFQRCRSIRTGNLTIEMQRIRIVCENLHIACVISIKSNTTFRTNAVPHFDASNGKTIKSIGMECWECAFVQRVSFTFNRGK